MGDRAGAEGVAFEGDGDGGGQAARTWRKRNAALVVATQSAIDITATPGAAPLLESMPTKLFLANPDFPAVSGRRRSSSPTTSCG